MAKNQAGGVAATVEKLVRPTLEGLGLRLWDLRFEKEGSLWLLRVLIDRADGAPMDTDTCEAATRAIDPLLDEADPIEQSYCLEVGSPGLGRRLTRPEHFAAFIGEKVAAKLYAPNAMGSKEVAGALQSAGEDGVTLAGEDGESVTVAYKAAASFKLCDDEGLFD